jgi:hypothetical protein
MGIVMMSCCAAAGVMLPCAQLATKVASPYESANRYSVKAQRQPTRAHVRTIDVEVDILSGMPNPSWTLSEADAAVFLSKLAGLQKAVARPRSVKLGYRGLVVRMTEEARRKIYIQNGVIEVGEGTASTFFLDPQRSLERWVIGTGRKFLSHEILIAIEDDLQK